MNEQQIVQETFKVSMKYIDLYGGKLSKAEIPSESTFRSNYARALRAAFGMDDEIMWNSVMEQLIIPPIPQETDLGLDYFGLIRQQMGTEFDPILICTTVILKSACISSGWVDSIRATYRSAVSYLFRVALVLQLDDPRMGMKPYEEDVLVAFQKLPPPTYKIETQFQRLERVIQPKSSTTAITCISSGSERYTPSVVEW